mmetsp:Transcript_31146/g.73108  ORF Transcript_31146/g.73108 Transcript_31146/m.73108 type:complete len:248 (-) Transcript_31146:21-764(-)
MGQIKFTIGDLTRPTSKPERHSRFSRGCQWNQIHLIFRGHLVQNIVKGVVSLMTVSVVAVFLAIKEILKNDAHQTCPSWICCFGDGVGIYQRCCLTGIKVGCARSNVLGIEESTPRLHHFYRVGHIQPGLTSCRHIFKYRFVTRGVGLERSNGPSNFFLRGLKVNPRIPRTSKNISSFVQTRQVIHKNPLLVCSLHIQLPPFQSIQRKIRDIRESDGPLFPVTFKHISFQICLNDDKWFEITLVRAI